MKVMMLSDSMGRGGSERRLTELLKGLRSIPDIQTELVVFSSNIQFEELFELGIPIHIIERKPKKDPRGFYKLYQLIRKSRPTIVHSWGSMSTIYALPARWWQNIILINAMIVDAPRLSILDQRYLRFKLTAGTSDLILANSRAGLKSYGAPTDKSDYVYNGFDFARQKDRLPEKVIREKYHLTTPYTVGMVGAFAPRKDYETYIQIGNEILKNRADTTFVAVGDGPLLQTCRNMVDPSVRERFLFTGKITDVENLLPLFDIGILISNPELHGEGISNSIMEYMAAGLPVIANDNGGNKEIIDHGQTGYLMPSRDIDSWVITISRLLDDSELSTNMGRLGRERVRDIFSIKQMIEKFEYLYRKLAKSQEVKTLAE